MNEIVKHDREYQNIFILGIIIYLERIKPPLLPPSFHTASLDRVI